MTPPARKTLLWLTIGLVALLGIAVLSFLAGLGAGTPYTDEVDRAAWQSGYYQSCAEYSGLGEDECYERASHIARPAPGWLERFEDWPIVGSWLAR